jgi:hypothetical protein
MRESELLGAVDAAELVAPILDRRAAPPYEALLPWERLELIACLGALPG